MPFSSLCEFIRHFCIACQSANNNPRFDNPEDKTAPKKHGEGGGGGSLRKGVDQEQFIWPPILQEKWQGIAVFH